MRVLWTDDAIDSLEEIGNYIARDNPIRANSFLQAIRLQVEKLRSNPYLFKPGRIPGTRELVAHKNYIVVYRVSELLQEIEVLFVHPASKKFPSILK
jgi:toxin ParE1/3/4